ncbi:EF hand [Anatilimnocola aggregata]|uniref:EF hand n=1 Tax=Anatilimnocola aggregata TaxID=2528021 RepID=A0A517Y9V4_9BACT|nr:EF-hand domain-containing protein [Anatilimnocola aggregata]QDU27017.1 EF hand [Anatilimnocola aggregata]
MKILTGLVFGCCAVVATGLWAEEGKGPGKRPEGKGPPPGAKRGPGGPGGEAMRAEMLKKFDKDGDGKLSEDERASLMAAMKERGGRPGGPGAGKRGPGGPGRPNFAELMKKFDKDGDGKLSEDERAAAREAMPKGGPGRRPGGPQGEKKPE